MGNIESAFLRVCGSALKRNKPNTGSSKVSCFVLVILRGSPLSSGLAFKKQKRMMRIQTISWLETRTITFKRMITTKSLNVSLNTVSGWNKA